LLCQVNVMSYDLEFPDNVSYSSQDSNFESVSKRIGRYEQQIYKDLKNDDKEMVSCKICHDKSGQNDNYVILSCNHVFHIQCAAQIHLNDILTYHVIDNEYFSSRKCTICDKVLQTEELMFIHSKHLASTKEKMDIHQQSISKLEQQLKMLKDELRACYEYKHKLEHGREKSKEIVASLINMM